jgi:hypothetical protein
MEALAERKPLAVQVEDRELVAESAVPEAALAAEQVHFKAAVFSRVPAKITQGEPHQVAVARLLLLKRLKCRACCG